LHRPAASVVGAVDDHAARAVRDSHAGDSDPRRRPVSDARRRRPASSGGTVAAATPHSGADPSHRRANDADAGVDRRLFHVRPYAPSRIATKRMQNFLNRNEKDAKARKTKRKE